MTNNVALIEIKTPQTKLLNKKLYREGVYSPSTELSGAINQLLDQKNKFEREMATFKNNSRQYDLESYSVHGILIVGKVPIDDIDQQKSFELFRRNSKNIDIVTFDELLNKVKNLYTFLTN